MLREISLGNGEELIVAANQRAYLFRVFAVLYLAVFLTFATYMAYREYFEWVLAIVTLVAGTAVAWPSGERGTRTSVAMVPGMYEVLGKTILVTIVNQGDPVIIGEVVLVVGWVEKAVKGLRQVPWFRIVAHTSVYWTFMHIETGGVLRVCESDVREAFKGLLTEMEDKDKDLARKYGASLLVFAMDARGFEPEARQGPFAGLLSACDLGVDFGIAEKLDLSEPFKMAQMRMRIKGEGKGPRPATLEFRAPPFQLSTREILAWILEEVRAQAEKKAKTETEKSRNH
jgi:hypothetical protein